MKVLYNEDFKDFPLGEFPYDKGHTALGEYHCFKHPGYYGAWYDPISLHQWRSMDGSWLITSDGTNRFLEQNRGDNSHGAFSNVLACLVLREKFYKEYTLSCNIRAFDKKEFVGVCFNYITSRDCYAFGFKEDSIILYKRHEETFDILENISFHNSDLETYSLKIVMRENDMDFFLNDELLFNEEIKFIPSKCGVCGKAAARYSNFVVSMSDDDYSKHLENKKKALELLDLKKKNYPKMELIKKISLGNGGSGRQIRLFTYQNEAYFFLAQHQKRMIRDSYARLSCLTLYSFKGEMIYQIGEANNSFDNTMISCDLPFQVADINDDGKPELIYSIDFVVYIADALTGKVIKSFPTPFVDDEYPFSRLNVDAIRVADFSGKGYKSDFIIKDRYHNVWAYSYDFELLFRYNHKNTGHFPYVYDFDGDGKDELFIGYDLVDHDGKIIWSLPMNSDHTDEIIYINTTNDSEKRLFLASGNEGFNIINMDGSIFKHNEIGHAQRISIANYLEGTDDLQIIVTAFWGSDGIVHSYDSFGDLKYSKEQMTNGNVLCPVNYDGEHVLCLMNSSTDGGLVDFSLDPVVDFPEDGHPILACEVYDIDSDGVDEILCFDQNEMWIYKASKFKSATVVARYPDEGFSNYRGEYLVIKKK